MNPLRKASRLRSSAHLMRTYCAFPPSPCKPATGPDGTSGGTAADELDDHLAPMRPRAGPDQVNALPSAERQLAADHRYVQRHAGEHRLDVARHIVRPFDGVNPA